MVYQQNQHIESSDSRLHGNTFSGDSHRLCCSVDVKITLALTSQWEFSTIRRSTAEPIIIHRRDIEKLLAYPKKPRNQLIHELAAYMGFRTGEICTERIEWMDVDSGKCYVEDSKKRVLYPIPLNYSVAKLAQNIAEGRDEGLLILRFEGRWRSRRGESNLDKPIKPAAIWGIVRRAARKAGIKNWQEVNPRLLRHYFAATFAKGKNNKPGNIEALRRILRHDSLISTQFYLARLFFFEDIQAEYDRIHALPIERRSEKNLSYEMLSSPVAQQCKECPARLVCKHVDEALNSEWASGCKFYPQIMEEMKG